MLVLINHDNRKEDLSLYKNQLNYMQTAWTVGYVIGELPSNIILTRVRASYWIPALEVGAPVSWLQSPTDICCFQITWSVLTMLMAKCNTAQQVYVLRFFIGKFNANFCVYFSLLETNFS